MTAATGAATGAGLAVFSDDSDGVAGAGTGAVAVAATEAGALTTVAAGALGAVTGAAVTGTAWVVLALVETVVGFVGAFATAGATVVGAIAGAATAAVAALEFAATAFAAAALPFALFTSDATVFEGATLAATALLSAFDDAAAVDTSPVAPTLGVGAGAVAPATNSARDFITTGADDSFDACALGNIGPCSFDISANFCAASAVRTKPAAYTATTAADPSTTKLLVTRFLVLTKRSSGCGGDDETGAG